MKFRTLSITIDAGTLRKLDEMVIQKTLNRSATIRLALNNYFKHQEE